MATAGLPHSIFIGLRTLSISRDMQILRKVET
jgi:hypothetical protein